MIRLLVRWISLQLQLVQSWWHLRRLRAVLLERGGEVLLARAGEELSAGTLVAVDRDGVAHAVGPGAVGPVRYHGPDDLLRVDPRLPWVAIGPTKEDPTDG